MDVVVQQCGCCGGCWLGVAEDCIFVFVFVFFFFQAEDGIRDAQESRGLGDVYKRQIRNSASYGNEDGLWELAVLDTDGKIDYTTSITDDVLGYLTTDDVEDILEQIKHW